MSILIDSLSWLLLVSGGLLVLIGGVGALRLPEFYTRMHAASLTDSMGSIFILVGVMLQAGLSQAAAHPVRVAVVATVIFLFLNLYAWAIDRDWRIEKAGWVLYLGAVSAWEEWVFRVAMPYHMESLGVSFLWAVLISNLLFGAAHYFTLRWKWQWCLGAFLFGMGLSKQFHEQENLALIIVVHWVVTFLNTPRLPGGGRKS